ncbi:BZ3500_MvSof-1268-A1-R1_Chr3-1g05909 [Microbotryum saponariae]|uniref:BZ3500_MvSof-1268-A1-R1_Chr3-1g05909 protein n=1 Tax=Microbotryum saponariae TaxID=289078 RepID=A0A2X0LGV0_9BASI|nr:BZ3500_MvSof-1268-A1-R1_Chr3-1g05909 [Microbotryum saponariae]SDA05099.1 BZ3501_MvSof-1269-A2-R1_Chr3-1g05579 [Microbotryum saponariae]
MIKFKNQNRSFSDDRVKSFLPIFLPSFPAFLFGQKLTVLKLVAQWKAAHLSLSLLCAVAIFVLGWIGKPGRSSLRWRLYRSFALVKIYGMDREERSLVFLPALETQPREDIRRCRGDE